MTELGRLREQSQCDRHEPTSALWHYILSVVFRGNRWQIATRGLHDGGMEICVYKHTQGTESVPVLLWRGQPPRQWYHDRYDVESNLEAQAHQAALTRLADSGSGAIWIMTSFGASAKVWAVQPILGEELTSVWPDDELTRRPERSSYLHNPQNPRGVPFIGPGSRDIQEEEAMHGPITLEGVGHIPEDSHSQRRAVRALRAGREVFGPEDAAGHGREPEYRLSAEEVNGELVRRYAQYDVEAMPDDYNDIKTFPEDYEELLARIKENPGLGLFSLV